MKIQFAFAAAVFFVGTMTPLCAQTPATPSAMPSASPSPQPSASPVPVAIKPPAGWKLTNFPMEMGPMKSDGMWALPGKGAIISMHADTFGMKDVSQYAAAMRKGLELMGGPHSVVAFKATSVCGGKQKGWYAEVHLTQGAQHIVEKMTIALSDRAYIAEYVRAAAAQDDPAAIASIMSLCAP